MEKSIFTPFNIGSLTFSSPLAIGAGVAKTLSNSKLFFNSYVSILEMGSYTVEDSPGNKGDTYFPHELFSLNAMGLPGLGIRNPNCIVDIKITAELFRQYNKEVFVSSAGFTPEEHFEICSKSVEHVFGLIVNLGCPNVYQGKKAKGVQSYSPDFIEATLRKLVDLKMDYGDSIVIIVKLSPFLFPVYGVVDIIKEMTQKMDDAGFDMKIDNDGFINSSKSYMSIGKIIKNSGIVDGVIAANTLGYVTITDKNSHKPVLSFGDGLHAGGLSGPIMKNLGLTQVRAWRDLLPADIAIIASGGITTGKDLFDYLEHGAIMGQVTSACLRDPSSPDQILFDYAKLAGLIPE